MGFFDGGGGGNNDSNDLMQEQMNQNKVELEQKRKSLVDQKIAIVKSQGAQNWTPERPKSPM